MSGSNSYTYLIRRLDGVQVGKLNIKLILLVVAAIIIFQIPAVYSICKGQDNIQMIYQLKPGENINTVAKKFGISAEKLKKLNNIDGATCGDRLKIE